MKALVISSSFPYPTDLGRKVVMAGYLEFLCGELGAENVVYATADTEFAEPPMGFRVVRLPIANPLRRLATVAWEGALARRKPLQEAMFANPTALGIIEKLLSSLRPDVLLVDTVRMAHYAEPATERVRRRVMHLDDLYSLRYHRILDLLRREPGLRLDAVGSFARFLPRPLASVARASQKELLLLESCLLRRREIWAARAFDRALLLNDDETRQLAHASGSDRVETIRPLIKRPARHARRYSGKPVFLFLGSFTLPANVHALSAFLDALPAVLKRIPDATILVAGRSAKNGIRAKAGRYGDRVRFLDYVPDISRLMSTAAAMVAPICFGTGIKMKVLDALAHGLPLVSSRTAIDGTGITPGQEALVGGDLSAYPELLAAVLDPRTNDRMSEACLDLYEAAYSPEAVSPHYRHVFMT
jgi:glycosyltransferase involved in cell wall biosynthesis